MKARKSWAMAYCGMAAALSVALMLLGAVVPVLMFIAPAAASLLIATVCMECGMKMALTAYGAVSFYNPVSSSSHEFQTHSNAAHHFPCIHKVSCFPFGGFPEK